LSGVDSTDAPVNAAFPEVSLVTGRPVTGDGIIEMRLQIYVDPVFGSDRYLDVEPDEILSAEESYYKEFPLRKYPVTFIRLKNGKNYYVRGHLADQIRAAQTGSDSQPTANH
jgi:hypothetical protein